MSIFGKSTPVYPFRRCLHVFRHFRSYAHHFRDLSNILWQPCRTLLILYCKSLKRRYFPLFLLYNGATLPLSYPTLCTPDVNLRKKVQLTFKIYFIMYEFQGGKCMKDSVGNTVCFNHIYLLSFSVGHRLNNHFKNSLNCYQRELRTPS